MIPPPLNVPGDQVHPDPVQVEKEEVAQVGGDEQVQPLGVLLEEAAKDLLHVLHVRSRVEEVVPQIESWELQLERAGLQYP